MQIKNPAFAELAYGGKPSDRPAGAGLRLTATVAEGVAKDFMLPARAAAVTSKVRACVCVCICAGIGMAHHRPEGAG